MSLRKLCFFLMLAAIVGLPAVGRSNRRITEFDLLKPSASQYGPTPATDGSLQYRNQPTSHAGPGHFSARSEMLPAALLPVQSRNTRGLGAGKLLVASRDLADPHFAQTVVLLVHYDAGGVVGLILNRRTDLPLSRVLANLKAAKDRSDPVYVGGPVETAAVLALLKSPSSIEGAEPVFGGVYMISAKNVFEQTIATHPDPAVFHVYLGYAGWTNAQLRMEVELGSWFIFPADVSTVFNSDPDSLWPQMIRKTELKVAGIEPANTGAWTRVPVNR